MFDVIAELVPRGDELRAGLGRFRQLTSGEEEGRARAMRAQHVDERVDDRVDRPVVQRERHDSVARMRLGDEGAEQLEGAGTRHVAETGEDEQHDDRQRDEQYDAIRRPHAASNRGEEIVPVRALCGHSPRRWARSSDPDTPARA